MIPQLRRLAVAGVSGSQNGGKYEGNSQRGDRDRSGLFCRRL